MSSPDFMPNTHQPPAIEVPADILGPQQLSLLESLATFDNTNPYHNPREAVAARYLLEEQVAWGANLPQLCEEDGLVSYGDYQSALKNDTREARLEALLKQRIEQRSAPLPEDPNDFNGLMAAHAALDTETALRQSHQEALENQVGRAIGRIATRLTDAQVEWEMSHGTVDKDAREDLLLLNPPFPLTGEGRITEEARIILERQRRQIVQDGIRITRRAFIRQRTPSLTPEALTNSVRGYPFGNYGVMISELVASGILKRNIEENTLSLEPLFQPVGMPSLSTFLRGLFRKPNA